MQKKDLVLAACFQGSGMALVLKVIATTGFVEGIVTAVASAGVSGVFLLWSQHLTNKGKGK